MFVLTVWGFILIAVAALLPDSAWEKFPEKLLPVRDFLAEKNIISSQFRPENRDNAKLALQEKAVSIPLTVSKTEIAGQETPRNIQNSLASPMQTGNSSFEPVASNTQGNDSKLVIPPFPGTKSIQHDPARSALPDSKPAGGKEQASGPIAQAVGNPSSAMPAKVQEKTSIPEFPQASLAATPHASPDSLAAAGSDNKSIASATLPGTPQGNIPASGKGDNETKKSSYDTLPELSFDNISPSPPSGQNLSIDTAVLTPSGTTGTSFPTVNTKAKEPEKPIANATLPDVGVISTTSATNTSMPSFPSVDTLNLNNSQTLSNPAPKNTAVTDSIVSAAVPQEPLSPTTKQAVQTSPDQGGSQINPSQELVQALVLSRNPNEIKSAFFKLNQLLERYRDTYSAAELEQLHKSLDRLAFTVFYDPKQHVLEPEYVIGPGETLASVAGTYKITPEHLAALNGLAGPEVSLAPGTKLKVIRGPVSANVSMSKKELLLLYDGLYAGRFKMGCAANAKALRGILSVTRKIASPQYIGPLENGTQGEIAGGDPRNPLGPFWIELNNGLGLQGTNHPEFVGNETAQQGGLIFSNKDITHLNILLPAGANVYLKD